MKFIFILFLILNNYQFTYIHTSVTCNLSVLYTHFCHTDDSKIENEMCSKLQNQFLSLRYGTT